MEDTRSRRWAVVGAVLGLTGLGLQFYLTFTTGSCRRWKPSFVSAATSPS
ncbi:hypothetical protein [Hymenobacter sp. 102]